MNKAKSVCQQIFLYLLLALSVASTVCSAILFRTSSLAVENKEFIDTAIGSVDKAHELLEQRDIYASMLIGSIIAVLVCMLLIFLWYFVRSASKKRRTEKNTSTSNEKVLSQPTQAIESSAENSSESSDKVDL
jgi:hypothetical protein